MSIAAFTQIPTYKSLVNVIQVYLNRYDQDTLDTIPFFINAAEKTILRNLRMPAMEKMVVFNLANDGNPTEGFINLPSDYLEMKFVWVNGADATTLQRVTFDQLLDYDNKESAIPELVRNPNSMATPAVWAINAKRIYIRPNIPTRDIYMTYYSDIPEISETTNDNVLLDLAPDAFAYLAVAEGFRFLMEEQKADYWETQGMKRLMQIKEQVYDAEFSGSPLVISPI